MPLLPFRKAGAVLTAALIAFTPLTAQAGQDVTYQDGDVTLQGYWADSACEQREGPAPVVMIVHQWKGLGDYEKKRADMLTEECYDAFAIDIYGQGVRPQTRTDAAAQSGKYKNNPALARQRLQAALDFARSRNRSGRAAIIGYCFGGSMALELARSGEDIDAAVSFHGGLSTQAPVTRPGVIDAAVQVHHGAADPHVPEAQVKAFMEEMETADADWMLIHYADAVHSFTEKEAGDDPSTGSAYNEKADKRSWAATLDFLEMTLGE